MLRVVDTFCGESGSTYPFADVEYIPRMMGALRP